MTALDDRDGVASPVPRPPVVAGLRLTRLVGSGGEGEVWEAIDGAGRRRALKLVRPHALADDVERRIAALLRIDHPALVRVTRGGRVCDEALGGWGFVEMDFVDGPSLHDAAADPQVLSRLEPLAEALDLLHAGAWSDGVPLVHRDVKPANLVASAGGLVLVDPSTLRGVDATAVTRVGTPVFSAPEVLTGRIGPPADVYSFAVTVVALLTGARGVRLAALVEQAATLDLPAGVGLALAPLPADRPASCRAVLAAGVELAGDPTALLPALVAPPAPTLRLPVERVPDRPATRRAGRPGEPTRGAGALRPRQERPAPTVALEPPQRPSPPAVAVPPGSVAPRAQAARRRVWPWTWLFVALVALPVAGWASEWLDGQAVLVTLAAAAGVHVVAHAVARRPLLLAVTLPPVAWALLLAVRVPGGRLRQGWSGAVLTGATGLVTAALLAALPASGSGLRRQESVLLVGAALALVVAGVGSATARGMGGLLLRVAMLPLWLAGAVVVSAGALLLAPFLPTARMAGTTLASIVEVARGPRPDGAPRDAFRPGTPPRLP